MLDFHGMDILNGGKPWFCCYYIFSMSLWWNSILNWWTFSWNLNKIAVRVSMLTRLTKKKLPKHQSEDHRLLGHSSSIQDMVKWLVLLWVFLSFSLFSKSVLLRLESFVVSCILHETCLFHSSFLTATDKPTQILIDYTDRNPIDDKAAIAKSSWKTRRSIVWL